MGLTCRKPAMLVGLCILWAVGAGCDYNTLKQNNKDMQTTLDGLYKERDDLLKDNMRLATVQEDTQAQISGAQARAQDAEQKLDEAKLENQGLRARLNEKPPVGQPGQIDGVEVQLDGDRIRLKISAKALFAPGKTALTRAARGTLAKVAGELNSPTFANRALGVEGHTDSDPIKKTARLYKDNHDLSVQRARVVFDYLTTTGKVNPKRVFLAGYGPTSPVSPNTTAIGKARNRRVEVVIYNRTVGGR